MWRRSAIEGFRKRIRAYPFRALSFLSWKHLISLQNQLVLGGNQVVLLGKQVIFPRDQVVLPRKRVIPFWKQVIVPGIEFIFPGNGPFPRGSSPFCQRMNSFHPGIRSSCSGISLIPTRPPPTANRPPLLFPSRAFCLISCFPPAGFPLASALQTKPFAHFSSTAHRPLLTANRSSLPQCPTPPPRPSSASSTRSSGPLPIGAASIFDLLGIEHTRTTSP